MLLVVVAIVALITLSCGLAGGGKPGGGDEGGGGPSADWPWDDVPVYPEADTSTLDTWEDAGTAMQFEKVEGRYFETPDSVEDVFNFYKAEMPKNGWSGGETSTVVNDFSSVHWKKGDGEAVAIITISTDPDGNVRVMAVRAEEPKE